MKEKYEIKFQMHFFPLSIPYLSRLMLTTLSAPIGKYEGVAEKKKI